MTKPRKNKLELMREEARRLNAAGMPVTHAAIREYMEKRWPLKQPRPTEIWHALQPLRPKALDKGKCGPPERGQIPMVGQGTPVEVDGTKRYASIRAAAKAEGITMQAARKRLTSPTFPNWKLAE